MQTPQINLNGTNGANLLAQQLDVLHALRQLRDAMAKAAPHGRDYRTPEAFQTAHREYHERHEVVRKLVADYTYLADSIQVSLNR